MDHGEHPRLYEGWRPQRWTTAVSYAGSLRLVSLTDDGALRIVVEDAHNPNRLRWQFTFAKAPAYLNLLEEYRLELWGMRLPGERLGWTVQVPDSPWLALLRKRESLLDVHYPSLIHFQIATEDDVIDIVSPAAPEIVALGPAPAGSPPAGKSIIHHWPRDAEEIQRTLDSIVDEARAAQHRENDS
jgi:hypothetical protein